MASITQRTTADGRTRYDVRYRTPEGGQRTATHRNLREARAFARRTEGDKERGKFIDPHSSRVTFGDYSQQWLKQRRLRPRTVEMYDGIIKNHLAPTFGDKSLANITPATVRAWNAKLRATNPAGSTIAAKSTGCCGRSSAPRRKTTASHATHAH